MNTEYIIDYNKLRGQELHANYFCVNCHGLNMHYGDCNNPESYAILSSARIPKRNASNKKWNIFKNKFVYGKPIGVKYWSHYSKSWWAIHKDVK